jgi:hypothetical protein
MFLTYLSSHIMKQEPMMKKHNEIIESEIGETMKLLDEMRPLEVHHLFRVRLMERVEREFGEGAGLAGDRMGNRLDFRLAFMVLLLVVNLGSAIVSLVDGNQQIASTVSELLDGQDDEYNSQEFAYYDQNSLTGAEGTQTP